MDEYPAKYQEPKYEIGEYYLRAYVVLIRGYYVGLYWYIGINRDTKVNHIDISNQASILDSQEYIV